MKKSVMAAKNLEDLRDRLNELDRDRLNELDRDEIRVVDLSSLPVFSKREVKSTSEVWSWDKTRILVTGTDGWTLENRCVVCGEATFHCHHDQT